MLPSTVLCDARLHCPKRRDSIGQRHLKLQCLTQVDISDWLEDTACDKRGNFIIFLIQQRFSFRLDLRNVLDGKLRKLWKFLIRKQHVSIHHWRSLDPRELYKMDDLALCTIVKQFLRQDLTLQDIFPHQNYVFRLAQAQQGLKTIKLLLKLGLHIRDLQQTIPRKYPFLSECDDETPARRLFHTAVDCNSLCVVKMLFAQGLSVRDFRSFENYALATASRNGNLAMVKFLITTVGLTIEDIRSRNNNSTRSACECGHLGVVRFLVQQGLTLQELVQITNATMQKLLANRHVRVINYLKLKQQQMLSWQDKKPNKLQHS